MLLHNVVWKMKKLLNSHDIAQYYIPVDTDRMYLFNITTFSMKRTCLK